MGHFKLLILLLLHSVSWTYRVYVKFSFQKPVQKISGDDQYVPVGCWPKDDREAKGTGYKGGQNVTKDGYSCQRWSEQYPHEHKYYGEM